MKGSRSPTDAALLSPARAGRWLRVTRWMVEHPKVVVAFGLVCWLASCAGVWRYALKGGMISDELTAERQWLTQLQNWPGWLLVPAGLNLAVALEPGHHRRK